MQVLHVESVLNISITRYEFGQRNPNTHNFLFTVEKSNTSYVKVTYHIHAIREYKIPDVLYLHAPARNAPLKASIKFLIFSLSLLSVRPLG